VNQGVNTGDQQLSCAVMGNSGRLPEESPSPRRRSVVAFLASEDARRIISDTIHVDGGSKL
jgi:hypothetical protein